MVETEFELLESIETNLKRIADASEARLKDAEEYTKLFREHLEVDTRGMELATTFTRFIELAIEGGSDHHHVPVPPRPAHDPVDVSDFMDAAGTTDGDLFVSHIEGHLDPGEVVMCKICERTMKEIITANDAVPPTDGDVVVFPEELGEERDDVWTCPNCGHTTTRVEGMTWKVCGECHKTIPEDDDPPR